MINGVIEWSLRNRVLIILFTLLISMLGVRALKNTPVDAIPDLSDVQVIIKTSYPGQAPKLVEDQVTRPLSTAMLSVPGAHTVRGFSFYGDSYVYVLFDDDTDIYWARSRVLEYLNQVKNDLPNTAQPQLGPDASGVGWIFIYALQDPSGQHDLAQLRSLQDWLFKYELQSVPGVSEVAALGGMVKQYQVLINPEKLRFYNIPIEHIRRAIQRNNHETGASVIELAEAEYMLRATGYIQSREELLSTPLGASKNGSPLLVRHVAEVVEAPTMRRGVAELNGLGEAVGGIIVMRHGENAQKTIAAVKQKIRELKKSLPDGVQVTAVYDRSQLIERAIDNLWKKVGQELLFVAFVVFLFLFSVRSALVAVVTLPIGILISFLVMQVQGVNANIMSLGGIAIAIGAMIDGAIVMIENLKRKLVDDTEQDHLSAVLSSAKEVGPTLFFSLLIITISFMPVFTLEAEEGRLFKPLALTKTYAMAAAAFLSITLVPVLLYYFVKPSASKTKNIQAINNPIFSKFLSFYKVALALCLIRARWIMLGVVAATLLSVFPLQKLSSEFMPPLDEGDLMYMPTTHPGISIGKARELLQQTDKIIRTVPEVQNVFGKVGRAETATDPAPLTMIESFIQLKPKSQWRGGTTTQDIIDELESKVKFPGLTNAWVMPIKTRIDMLATGMKTPLGIKLAGSDIRQLQALGKNLEQLLGGMDETVSVYSERSAGGRYLIIDIDKLAASRYGLDLADVQDYLKMAAGGLGISEMVEGEERYPISLRFPDAYRNTPERLRELPLVSKNGAQLKLGEIADIRFDMGAPMLKSENGRLNTWIFLDIGNASVAQYVKKAEKLIQSEIEWPATYSLRWAGQYESIARVRESLTFIIPLTLCSIAILLFINFRRFSDVAILMASLPFALVGGLMLIVLLGFKLSVAVVVGFIALAGLAVETGAIMLQVLRSNVSDKETVNKTEDTRGEDLQRKIVNYAAQRVRPVLMTATATIAGLLPVMFGAEPGSEVMSRIAAPVIGGLVTSVLLTLFVLPVSFYLWGGARKVKKPN